VHEFNNQLTFVLCNLDRLREHLALDRQAQAFTDRIEASALALGRTVQHLKDLSNQAPVEVSRISLQEALAPFLATLTNLPARIRVTTEWPEGQILCLDPERLRLALQALVANSLEAIPDQGHLRLWAEADGDILRLVLEDDGRGMPPEVLERAFDPFFSTKPVGSGRGLGLSIAFSLARQMGGELLLDSRLGQGTRAELRFPLTLPREACAPAGLRVPRRNRVLLADDEVSIRELTRECLEADGFQVSEAGDGIEALSRFETDPEGWDLVILDLIMPRMHGSEVLQRIHARRPDLPVLLISGYSSEARPDLLVGPHRRFLAKPFRLRDLRTVLTELGLSPSPPA
jgi:CheY-like chemotaxis protein/two-component sensor histidine kinase